MIFKQNAAARPSVDRSNKQLSTLKRRTEFDTSIKLQSSLVGRERENFKQQEEK